MIAPNTIPFDLSSLYFMIFLIFLTILNVIGYLKIPILQLISLIVIAFIAIASLTVFKDYEIVPAMFILINAVLSVVGLSRLRG